MKTESRADSIPWLLLFVFVSLASIIVAAGYYFFALQERSFRENQRNEISAVTALKVNQILRWRYEREGDAQMIRDDAAAANAIAAYCDGRASSRPLISWLDSFRQHDGYLGVTLFDSKKKIRLFVGNHSDTIGVVGKRFVDDVLHQKRVLFSDLRLSGVTHAAIMDLFIPISDDRSATGTLTGVLRLSIDPSHILFPLIQSWPTPSRTGETILVRREGDSVLVLNDLRHRVGSALTYRLPLTDMNSVLTKAGLGIEGTMKGDDDRGVPVLAAVQRIPNSTWVMVAKIDEAELSEPLKRQSLFIVSLAVLAIVAAGSVTGWWWRNQRATFYRRQYQAELERRSLTARFENLLRHANDIIILVDTAGTIVEANDRALSSYGYGRDELIRMNIDDLRGPDATLDTRAMRALSRQRDGVVYETVQRKRDGTLFPVEVSLRSIEIEGATYYQGIMRDITERKRAEASLKEREALLRESQRVGKIGSYVLDIKTGRWTASEALDEIFGVGPGDEKIFETWERLLHPEQREEMLRYFRDDVVDARKPFDKEYRIVRLSDRADRWVWGKGELEFREDGVPLRMIGTIQDITDRRATEEALRANEQLMRVALAPINMAVFSQDRDLRYTWIYQPQLGFKPEEVVGKTDEELLPPEAASAVATIKRRVLESGNGAREEVSVPWHGGTVYFDLVVEPLRNSAGSIVGLTGATLDISERKRSEEALRASELKYRDIFTWAPIGIYQSSIDGKIMMANESLLTMLGYASMDELHSMTMQRDLYYDPAQRAALIRKYDQPDAGYASNIEVRWRKKDGSPIWISLTAHSVKNAAGKTLYYEGFVHDITERKAMEDQVRQAQKLESVGTLASGIAHDFNNILGIILGHISLLKRKASNAKALALSVDSISQAAQRGAMLVRQLLTFARKTETFAESIQVNDIISELARLMAETFPKSISVTSKLDPQLPHIIGDATQLHQVFLNLCVNARDAMPSGGILSIATDVVTLDLVRRRFSAADAPQYVRVVVSDTGTGMDEVTRTRIFEPFFTTKGPGKGTGLGMSVVYGIVESHEGFIDVESSLGAGTVFTIVLPVLPTVTKDQPEAEEKETAPGGSETILIAEDEEMLRTVLRTTLEENGYSVLTAVDGNEALGTYKEHYREIALVVSDVGLPGLTGDNLFLSMKAINPSVRMVLSSGFIEPETKTKILNSGVREFIQKPYVLSEILTTIRKVLDTA